MQRIAVTVWPNEDSFFYLGICDYIKELETEGVDKNIVFINFSSVYIRQLISTDWLSLFSDSHLIIFTDKYMKPLANYMIELEDNNNVARCIISNHHLIMTDSYIRYILSERPNSPKYSIKLSALECKLLMEMILGGGSYKEVAMRMNINMRSFYAAKKRIEYKIGVRIIKLICMSQGGHQ